MAAVFLAGATAGFGGSKLGSVSPPAPEIRVHALDLRRGQDLPDGGFEVRRVAYGTLVREDGGTKDIGQAKTCATSPARQVLLEDELRAAANECDWNQ